MMPQERSLANLSDVVSPPDISMWPSAPGWTMVWVFLLLSIAVVTVQVVRRHRALRYRREALRELGELRAAGEWQALPALLKRVALCVHPRAEVASLSGADWSRFLDEHGGDGRFEGKVGEALTALAYGGESPADMDGLADATEQWIRAQPARFGDGAR